jgi:hypothetical protein
MPNIEPLPRDYFRNLFFERRGHTVGVLGDNMGYAAAEVWYDFAENFAEAWKDIVSGMPIVGGFLGAGGIAIMRVIYDIMANWNYLAWADRGEEITQTFDNLIADTQNKINAAVEDMKNKMQTEILDPLQAKADKIRTDLDRAQSQLDTLNNAIDQAKKQLGNHENRISNLEASMRDKTGLDLPKIPSVKDLITS